jgi:hypothetical protein
MDGFLTGLQARRQGVMDWLQGFTAELAGANVDMPISGAGVNTAALPGGLPAGAGAATLASASAGGTTIQMGGVTLQVQGVLDFRDGSTATRKMVEDLRAELRKIERSYSS